MWSTRNIERFLRGRKKTNDVGGIKDGVLSYKMMSENIATVYEGLIFNKSSPYYEDFNEMIGRMMSSGLTDYWYANDYSRDYDKSDAKMGPQVLTLEHLKFGFLICIALLAIGLLLFMAERLVGKKQQVTIIKNRPENIKRCESSNERLPRNSKQFKRKLLDRQQ